jgi:hypothetical protein
MMQWSDEALHIFTITLSEDALWFADIWTIVPSVAGPWPTLSRQNPVSAEPRRPQYASKSSSGTLQQLHAAHFVVRMG